MALNTSKCNHLAPLRFKGLNISSCLLLRRNVYTTNYAVNLPVSACWWMEQRL